LKAVNPFVFTVATLTNHVVKAYGQGYSVWNYAINDYLKKNIWF
jgi:hypothetical protein